MLEAAYNDARGVTAEFNLNVLHVVNRELGADFDVDAFQHVAFYNVAASRIEMHLRSRSGAGSHDSGCGHRALRGRRDDPHGDQLQVHPAQPGAECSPRCGLELESWTTDAAGWYALATAKVRA